MKKVRHIIILFIVGTCSYLIITGMIFKQHPMLDENDYIDIESIQLCDVDKMDKNSADMIVKLLNSTESNKTFRRVTTLQSPDISITFFKKDGTNDNIDIYGDAYKNYVYIHYNDIQYKLKEPNKFFDEVKRISQTIRE